MLTFQVDLTNCDREPIHIPGSIQPHGCLLAFDGDFRTLLRHSANAGDLMAYPSIASGSRIEEIFGQEMAHALRNALAASVSARRPSLLFGVAFGGLAFDISIHRSAAETIVELERSEKGASQPLDIVRTVIARVSRSDSVETLARDTVRMLRAILGYDRVMMYRFEDDGAGQVISEAKSSNLESFLGQYFPSSDIPKQARALYLTNTIRIITDSSGVRVPIIPELDEAGRPLDLSHAHLRSVSPIHCEYLRNMGVAASMSISIIIDGTLWGLVACHHYAPKKLNMAERVAVEMFGEFLSLHLDVIRQKSKLVTAHAARRALDGFLERAPRHADIVDLLRQSLQVFSEMLPCDGVGLWLNGTWTPLGTTPPLSEIPHLAQYVGAMTESRVWASHTLCSDFIRAKGYCADTSGVLAIPLTQRPRDYLFFFRKEFEHTLNWAGNPSKSYDIGSFGDRLTPRKSFAIWKEEVREQSRRWTDTDLETAEAIRSALVEIVLRHNEIINEERGKADLRQRMLNEELNHRVKNILAVIKSLVAQPNPEERSLDEYLSILKGRIEALAIAHDQIVRGEGGGLLKDLLKAEVEPFRDQALAIRMSGPPVWIDTSAFSVLALVIHEMATNSAKYGALSRQSGTLTISWSMTGQGGCEILWQEVGGPVVTPPRRKGFGTILISRSIPHDLGGESDVDYHPEGVQARFVIPAKHTTAASRSKDAEEDMLAVSPRSSKPALDDLTLMLVEDQMLIALDAEMMLSDEGLNHVVTVSSTAEALKRLQTFSPTIAILDLNLGGSTSLPVAEELRRRDIPFLFATGYGDGSIIAGQFQDVPVVKKPYTAKQLMPVIMELLSR